MFFDPADNLFGAPIGVWIGTAIVWGGLIWLFAGPGPSELCDRWRRRRARRG